MGPAVYVMAILGCGEGADICEPVSLAPVRYESQEACNAATASMIERHTDILYPVVVAECRAAGAQVTKVYSDEVKLPAPDDRRVRVQRASYPSQRARS